MSVDDAVCHTIVVLKGEAPISLTYLSKAPSSEKFLPGCLSQLQFGLTSVRLRTEAYIALHLLLINWYR